MTKDNIQQKKTIYPVNRFASRIPQSLQAGIDLARRLRESPKKMDVDAYPLMNRETKTPFGKRWCTINITGPGKYSKG